MQYLRRIEKPYAVFCATKMTNKLAFLPHIDELSTDTAVWKDEAIDTIIVFDSSSPDYAGIAGNIEKMKHKPQVINIDHHKTNDNYGDLNLVLPQASSTTEVLYRFFRHNKVTIDTTMATSLLTGIITDTGNFTNSATTRETVKIASKLIGLGGDLSLIQGCVLKDKTMSGLKLWGNILERMDHHPELDIVYTYVTKDDLKKHEVDEEEIEGFANFMNNIKDGRAGMILKEKEDGTFKGSFRTTNDHVDVSAFAKLFNGGGHKKAAGFSVDGPLEHAIEHVFEKINLFERGELALAEV